MQNFGNGGVKESVGSPRANRADIFLNTPLCEVRGVKIDLRPPGVGIFDLKYCHCAG